MAPDLKWVFFYIPLAKESQFLFAFAWNAPEGNPQQFPWIVLPQGFRGNTLHFGQGLAQDLRELHLGQLILRKEESCYTM